MKDANDKKKALISFLRRFHLVIFIVATVLILSVAVALLYRLVDKASGVNSTGSGGTTTSFDQETIDRIKELKTSDEPSEPLNLSEGRIDPFNE